MVSKSLEASLLSSLLINKGKVVARAKSKVVLPIRVLFKKPLPWEATISKSASCSSPASQIASKGSSPTGVTTVTSS